MRIFLGWVGRGFDTFVRALLPERCPACGAAVRGGGMAQPAALCPRCFAGLTFAQEPRCDRCGWLLAMPDAVYSCGAGGAIRRRRFALLYGATATRLILKLKHADRPDIAARLAAWMALAGNDVIAADLLVPVPVPVHWSRLLHRQYNQSAELVRHLAAMSGKPADARALKRLRATPSQGHLSVAARRANVAGAFAARRGLDLTGRTVLLIDDVATTGATAEACAQALLRSGAVAVDLLIVAVVPPDGAAT